MNIIKQVRIPRGETQTEFAKVLGISLDTVKSLETGRRHPKSALIEMLMQLNNNPALQVDLEALHPVNSMANDVLEYIEEQKNLHGDDVELRFVFCGMSGCGKTRTVSIVNKKLTKGAELAECNDLIHPNKFCKAWEIVIDKNLAYQNSKHIVFNVMNEDLASSLEFNGIRVFRFD